MTLLVGLPYHLSGLRQVSWTNSHPRFGQPDEIGAIYLGAIRGTRLWHLFEVQVQQTDQGVILMSDADLVQITVKAL